jgi:membrane protein required for colicin V production
MNNTSLPWPDLVIGLILILGIWRGYARGFVAELMGAVALGAAIFAAFVYPGMWDGPLGAWTHLGAGSAHVIGMLAFSGIAYGIVVLIGRFLARVAKLPVLGLVNSILGAVVGLAWSAVFCWLVLFIALYFPLSTDLRKDLGKSHLVAVLEGPNPAIDDFLKKSMPWFMKPFSDGIFNNHRV